MMNHNEPIWKHFDLDNNDYRVALIAGEPSCGMTPVIQEYIVSKMSSMKPIWVIDAGRNYKHMCHLLNGEYIELQPIVPFSINPFSVIDDFNQSSGLLKLLLSAIASPSSELEHEESCYLEKAIEAAWCEKGREASISTVAFWLDKQEMAICKTLFERLKPYTKKEKYGCYFEGTASINLSHPFSVIELGELNTDKNLQRIIFVTLLFHIFESMMLNRSQFKFCLIHKICDLLKGNNDGVAGFIEVILRTARRFSGGFITTASSLENYDVNKSTACVFNYAVSKIVFKHSPGSIKKLNNVKHIYFDPRTKNVLKILKESSVCSECLIQTGDGINTHRFQFGSIQTENGMTYIKE